MISINDIVCQYVHGLGSDYRELDLGNLRSIGRMTSVGCDLTAGDVI